MGARERLPAGTVTLLLADVEGSSGLWEIESDTMRAAIGRLNDVVAEAVAASGGVRPVEQGEGDSFVVAFARASDAVACALALQRAPLAPIRLRIGIHTGEVLLRDEGNYVGPMVNRAGRLRDLAHGGQTVLSGATHDLVVDALPFGAWLTDLGVHRLRGLGRPERVIQLCHRDVRVDFPPLRSADGGSADHLPPQLTRFVGREAEIVELRRVLTEHRLVTLIGAGGVGKTRLAVQVAAAMASAFIDGVWMVELAPVTDPAGVPIAVLRALGLPDEHGQPASETLGRFVADRRMLVVLDNCEHLLDASAALINDLLARHASVAVMATSREPVGVPGEVTWRVPSLSLSDEAIELFVDRARLVRPDFRVADDNAAAVAEICRRLDGVPLAIELAAARLRALSPGEVVAGVHDRFRLLTGGSRTAVPRQQTLRASVDWSHALLTEPERILFRRLAVFLGGFDLDAARSVAADERLGPHQVLDQLVSLVDKSLVSADEAGGHTRYRLLETVRQYALEKLGESDEADVVRRRHRDHYTPIAAQLEAPGAGDVSRRLDQVEAEIDNLRAAFEWSRDEGDTEAALRLASSLQPLWLGRRRIREGLSWLVTALADRDRGSPIAPAVLARSLADRAVFDVWASATDDGCGEEALAIARQLDDAALVARALMARGLYATYHGDFDNPFLAEAVELARTADLRWILGRLLAGQALNRISAGDPRTAGAAAEEGVGLAVEIGDHYLACQCRVWLAEAQLWQGRLDQALANLRLVVAEAESAGHLDWKGQALCRLSRVLAFQGDVRAATAVAEQAIAAAADDERRDAVGTMAYWSRWVAALAAGDVEAMRDAVTHMTEHMHAIPLEGQGFDFMRAETALASGDLPAATTWADKAVASSIDRPYHAVESLLTRARVALALGDSERADTDAHQALVRAVNAHISLLMPQILDCLAHGAWTAGSHQEAVRLYATCDAIRQRIGTVPFALHQADHQAAMTALRAALGDEVFTELWKQGAALSLDEAVAYVQRGRGERRRPSSGWAALTPTERDVVRLVTEGLPNHDIATRMFVSPRTVQSHLTHVYAKLGITSRVQLAQEGQRHRHTTDATEPQ